MASLKGVYGTCFMSFKIIEIVSCLCTTFQPVFHAPRARTHRHIHTHAHFPTESIHHIGATEHRLLLTLQLSLPLCLNHPSPSPPRPPCPPPSRDRSKLLILSMPSQMVSHTVKACTTRFQHPSNKPSSQLQMACRACF